MDLDPTTSQDIAFATEEKADVFNFDAEPTTQESQPEQSDTEAPSPSAEEEAVVEEQKVPYSRFKRKVEEVDEFKTRIQLLEEQLQDIQNHRIESKPSEDLEVPQEWKELYGDSDVSKKAWAIQLKREQALREEAVKTAIEHIRESQVQEERQLEENEELIDENLASLQEAVGRKLTPKVEEAILSIVDEFSPVGNDGKYISLFPFDKAYEIYELRQSKQGMATTKARRSVADLAGNGSEGEAETTDAPFKKGWDNWREAL